MDISEWSSSKRVTHSCAGAIFVPTKTSAEWQSFQTNKPACVTVIDIPIIDFSGPTGPGSQDMSVTSELVFLTPGDYTFSARGNITVTIRAGGGGGGGGGILWAGAYFGGGGGGGGANDAKDSPGNIHGEGGPGGSGGNGIIVIKK